MSVFTSTLRDRDMKILVFFALFFLGSALTVNAECGISPEELHSQRLETIRLESLRFFVPDYDTYFNLTNEVVVPDNYTRYIASTGKFPPSDSREYEGLVMPDPKYNPVPATRAFPTPDFSQLVVLGHNLYRLPVTKTSFTQYNPETGDYDVKIDGSRIVRYFVFEECGPRIVVQISGLNPDSDQVNLANARNSFDVTKACTLGMYACAYGAGGAYLNTTGFSSTQECIDAYTAIEEQGTPCQQVFSSNTIWCRVIHIVSAFRQPWLHCPHMNIDHPTVCVDSCLPECGNCDDNAYCHSTLQEDKIIQGKYEEYLSYECRCKEGYTGNGTVCERDVCIGDFQCTSKDPYSQCINGTCACNSNLKWNGDDGSCGCDNDIIYWDKSVRPHLPYCLTPGKCEDKWHCPQSDFNSFNCTQFPNPNTITRGDFCLCNPGYENVGMDSDDCVCNDPKRVVPSKIKGFNICIAPGECGTSKHCQSGQICIIQPNDLIGTCQNF